MEIYHASGETVEFPEVRKATYTKDFSWGFYCTNKIEQAKKWALKHKENPTINIYNYIENPKLKILKFTEMSDEWLDFIVSCRSGKIHSYDIVEGPMADDTIWNFLQDFISGEISREIFWGLAKFKHPTHQISFHTLEALNCISFERSINIHE